MDGALPRHLNRRRGFTARDWQVGDDVTDAASLLKRTRESRQMTQAHLAAAAGVSSRTVMRAEKGEEISPESMRAICAVLDLDAASLPSGDARQVVEGREGDMRPPEQAAAPIPWRRLLRRPSVFLGIPLGLVCGWLIWNSVPSIVLPGVYARHYPMAEVIGAFKAPPLAFELSRPMDALTGDVAPVTDMVQADWSIKPDAPTFFFQLCEDPVPWDFLFMGDRRCQPWKGGIAVRSASSSRFEASVGPMPGKTLAVVARLLTPNPGLSVRVAFTASDAPPGPGTLWLDPRHLSDGQVPRHPGNRAYLHVVAARSEISR